MQGSVMAGAYQNNMAGAMEDPFKSSYQENKVYTATKEELILMLYDGALKFMRFGLMSIEENNLPQIGFNILRAQKIIHYLDMCLNMDAGKEIAQNLSSLYEYVSRKLSECQREKKVEALQEAKKVIETLREAWSVGVVNKEHQA